jgi:hypothetical protein
MKLSDLLGTGGPVIIKNINIINTNSESEEDPIINPGIDYGIDDKAKWSPPLQQELSIMKSVSGITPSADTTELDTTELNHADISRESEKLVIDNPNHAELIKKLIAIFR